MLHCPVKESHVKLTWTVLFCLVPGQRWQAANWVKNKLQNGKPRKGRGHCVSAASSHPVPGYTEHLWWVKGTECPLPHTLPYINSVITAVWIKYISMTIWWFFGHSCLVSVAIASAALKKVSLDKTSKSGARNLAFRNLNQYEFLKMQTTWENRPNSLRMTESPGYKAGTWGMRLGRYMLAGRFSTVLSAIGCQDPLRTNTQCRQRFIHVREMLTLISWV